MPAWIQGWNPSSGKVGVPPGHSEQLSASRCSHAGGMQGAVQGRAVLQGPRKSL